jgi:hypothetical protein
MIFETNRRLSIIAIASLISACAHTGSAEQSRYPAVWFAPVHDTNPPSWEIFPQALLFSKDLTKRTVRYPIRQCARGALAHSLR